MMPHKNGDTDSQDEHVEAIYVARWLIVALPQDLADALDTYAASLEPETTASAATRRILQGVLLAGLQPCTAAVSPTGEQSPPHPIGPGKA